MEDAAKADPALRTACLGPLAALRQQVQQEESLPHITQAQAEALNAQDVAAERIQEFLSKWAEEGTSKDNGPVKAPHTPPAVRRNRIVTPAHLMKAAYLETADDVKEFIKTLQQELEQALANHERIQIR